MQCGRAFLFFVFTRVNTPTIKIKTNQFMGRNATTEHINEEMNKFSKSTEPLADQLIEQHLGLDALTSYVTLDAYIAAPHYLLGTVIEVRKKGDALCPNNIFDDKADVSFGNAIIGDFEAKDARAQAPQARSSIVVTSKTAAKIGFLSYLSAQLDASSSFSLMVFDQASGLIDTRTKVWQDAVVQWRNDNRDVLADESVCYVFAVTSFIQKNIVKKKFKEFAVGASGGAYGLNMEGKLYTSTDEFSLDVRFGLTPHVLKRPGARQALAESFADATEQEKKLLATIHPAALNGK
jgi:hypothetical protein